MADYERSPITIREIPGIATVQQDMDQAQVNGRPATMITAAAVLANPQHYFRTTYQAAFAAMQSGKAAAVVLATVNGKDAQILITPEQFAVGAPERERYSAWCAGRMSAETACRAAEREYDLINNEGGEGYNPHRATSERTYARAPVRDREYPEGA
jgi:hypothetical protein